MLVAVAVAVVVAAAGGFAACTMSGDDETVPVPVPDTWRLARSSPGHVAHVNYAGVACKDCHGALGFTAPPADACTTCHGDVATPLHEDHGTDPTAVPAPVCVDCHGFAAGTSAKPWGCMGCHDQQQGSFVPAVGAHGDEDCGSCHRAHESPSQIVRVSTPPAPAVRARGRARRDVARQGLASSLHSIVPEVSMSKSQVVVAYDFTKPADVALQRAIEVAARDPEQVLHFVTVLSTNETYVTADKVRDDLLGRLRDLFRAREPRTDVDFCVHVRLGKPADEILALAAEIGADLIILGCHDRNALGRILLGSVSTDVLHGARCPVTVARIKAYAHVKLEHVIEVAHVALRSVPHRYSYTSSIAQVRSSDWPIS